MLERREEQDFGVVDKEVYSDFAQIVSDHINQIKTEKEYWELYLESEIFRSSTSETFHEMYGWGAPLYFIRFRIRGFLRDLFQRLYNYFW